MRPRSKSIPSIDVEKGRNRSPGRRGRQETLEQEKGTEKDWERACDDSLLTLHAIVYSVAVGKTIRGRPSRPSNGDKGLLGFMVTSSNGDGDSITVLSSSLL